MQQTKILIVEDEPIVAMDLRQQMEEAGYQVVGIAENAEEALMAAEKNGPELALLDINIAGSMDGIQTAKILRQWFDVAGIFVTAFSDKNTVARAARQRPYGYLTKPIRGKELLATLQVALHKARNDAREREVRSEMVAAVDTIRDGLLLTSMDGKVQFMNAALENLSGTTLRQVHGKPFTKVLRLKNDQGQEVSNLTDFNETTSEVFGWKFQTENLADLPVDLSMNVSEDAEGKPRGIVFMVRDASERLRHQALGEVQDEKPGFDSAPMAMAQLDNAGKILRVNQALLTKSGVGAECLLGRSLTSLSMDPDPRIARDLMHMLLQEGTILAAPHQSKMN
ncbi:response regulator [Telmatobacter bradus]|uniref:response regulator n=1 Tax=Telmatobacter bradus TaxID=474953 RepID=UPI003B4356FB